MIEYSKEDFDRCVVNPMNKNLVGRTKEIIGDYEGRFDPRMLVSYIAAVYDPKSPLVKDYPELIERKYAGAGLAGFDESNQEQLKALFNWDAVVPVQDDEPREPAMTELDVLFNYLKIVKNRKWMTMQAIEQAIFEFNYTLMTPISNEDKEKDKVGAVKMKSAMSQDIRTMEKTLEELSEEFYGEEKDRIVKRKEVKRFRPETIGRL